MTDVEPTIFHVRHVNDWQPVAKHLIDAATTMPLDAPDHTATYGSPEAAMAAGEELIQEGRAQETIRYTVLVLHKSSGSPLSIMLTREPDTFHLSVTRIAMGRSGPELLRVSDAIAIEVTTAILGDGCEERRENAFPGVRDFYLKVA